VSAFGPLAARFFDATRGVVSDAELAWYARALPADGLLLDAMCGSGRHLVPWVRRGAKVHGVDASAAMLELCEGRLASAGAATTLVRQDIAALNLPFRYAGAFIAGGALQYLTDPAAVAASLSRLRAHLLTPGVLVVELRTPPASRRNLAAPLVEVETASLADGSRITRRSETTWTPDAKFVRAEHRYTRRRGTERLDEEHEIVRSTWYDPEDAVALLASAGFAVEASPSSVEDDGTTTLRVIARREA